MCAVSTVTPDWLSVLLRLAVVMLLQFWMIHMREQTAKLPTAEAGVGFKGYKLTVYDFFLLV